MNKQHFIYVIKCNTTGQMYVGSSSSDNPSYNPFKFMLKKANETKDEERPKFSKLLKSVNEHGYRDHTFCKTSKNGTREEVDKMKYDILTKLGDKTLNDAVIDPKKEKCNVCGKEIRVVYMKDHKEKYCTKLVDDILDALMA